MAVSKAEETLRRQDVGNTRGNDELNFFEFSIEKRIGLEFDKGNQGSFKVGLLLCPFDILL